MTSRDNLLRAARFECPDAIPMVFHINPACWHHYPQEALQELMLAHPLLFPGYRKVEKVTTCLDGDTQAGVPYTDEWGCAWVTTDPGIAGAVVRHPLADWAAFTQYTVPDAACDIDWSQRAATMAASVRDGSLRSGGLAHGHTFLRLCDIRGYENVLIRHGG